MDKPKVAFICVHNSCRSQMAEAIAKLRASDTYEAYSAGTEIKSEINEDAVEIIKKLYGVDMTETQKPKLVSDIPAVDVVISMGCNVSCPNVSCKYREDWGLQDPTGKGNEAFMQTARLIEKRVIELKDTIHEVLKEKSDVKDMVSDDQ